MAEHPQNRHEELRQVADLHRDLDLLNSGWAPDERVLRDAATIHNWYLDVSAEGGREPGILVLRGNVTGHPKLRHATEMRTSKLLAFNSKDRWARTASRFYRLGPSLYDDTGNLAGEPRLGAIHELKDYVAVCQSLRPPRPDQMWAFARHVSGAHSWYKHLPWYPPGVPFYFYVDPAAGMQRAVGADGSMQIFARAKPGFHYSWLPTAQYHEKFGHLAFAQSRGTSVSMVLQNGVRLIPADDVPSFCHPELARIRPIPKVILALGTSYVSAIVHPMSAPLFGFRRGLVASTDTQRPPWPEESGGPQQLEKIRSRLHELSRDPSLRRKPPIEEAGIEQHLSGDMELYSLLKPEKERQQRLMVEACLRVSDFIWSSCFLFSERPG
jgi:hypothetical protein